MNSGSDQIYGPELASGQEPANYQFRVFLPRGEVYAIRLAGTEVTGVCGPLDYREVVFSALPSFDYEASSCNDRPGSLPWVKANISDFVLCEAECDDSTIWI